jgi:hypothetical protein
LAIHRMPLLWLRTWKTGAVANKWTAPRPALGMAALTDEPCAVIGTAAAFGIWGHPRATQLHSPLTAGTAVEAKYEKGTGARWIRAVDTCTLPCQCH